MQRYELDVVIFGSSRPQVFKYLLDSLNRFVISQSQNTDYRFFLHEDFVKPKKSKKSVELMKEFGGKVIIHDPPIGYGPAMKLMLDGHVKTRYMFSLQDDWEIERTGIDIDRIIWVMNRHSNISSIVFNKWINQKQYGALKEFIYSGLRLSISRAWHVLPGIWRTSKARKYWQPVQSHPAGAFIKAMGGSTEDPEDAVRRIGSYWYGGMGEQRWVRHNGNTWKTTPWGLKKARLEHDVTSLLIRPPWIPFESRTTNKGISFQPHNEEEFDKLLTKLPENIRKEYER